MKFDVVNENEILLFRGTISEIMEKTPDIINLVQLKTKILTNIKDNDYKFYKTNKILYNNVFYSMKTFMKMFNLSRYSFEKIVWDGHTHITDKDIVEFTKTRDIKKIFIRGRVVEYKTFADLIKIISNKSRHPERNSFTERYNSFLEQCKNDEQKAIDMLVEWYDNLDKINVFIDKDGNKIEYKSIVELCKKLNKDYQTVLNRMKDGYTLEESIYVKKEYRRISTKKIKNICREKNKSFIDVCNFMLNVYTLDYALENTTREFIENDE